jgi:hypothetical protein
MKMAQAPQQRRQEIVDQPDDLMAAAVSATGGAVIESGGQLVR